MRLIAKKPCSYGGKKFFIGDEIPAELVVNIEREEKLGVMQSLLRRRNRRQIIFCPSLPESSLNILSTTT